MDDLTKNKHIKKMISKAGLRPKLDAKCFECIYDPYQEGSWRKQVNNCTSYTCPLYSVRAKSSTKNQQKGVLQ